MSQWKTCITYTSYTTTVTGRFLNWSSKHVVNFYSSNIYWKSKQVGVFHLKSWNNFINFLGNFHESLYPQGWSKVYTREIVFLRSLAKYWSKNETKWSHSTEIDQKFNPGTCSSIPAKPSYCDQCTYVYHETNQYLIFPTAGSLIFKPFAKKSPFLVNQMDSYFLGGTHDMASWSTRLMEDTAYMLDHGISSFNCFYETWSIRIGGLSNFNSFDENAMNVYYSAKWQILIHWVPHLMKKSSLPGTSSCYLTRNSIYVQCINLTSSYVDPNMNSNEVDQKVSNFVAKWLSPSPLSYSAGCRKNWLCLYRKNMLRNKLDSAVAISRALPFITFRSHITTLSAEPNTSLVFL